MSDQITTERLVPRRSDSGDGADIAVARWLTHVPHRYTQAMWRPVS